MAKKQIKRKSNKKRKKILTILLISLLLAGGFAGAYYGNEDFKNWVGGSAKIEIPVVTPPTETIDARLAELEKQLSSIKSQLLILVEENSSLEQAKAQLELQYNELLEEKKILETENQELASELQNVINSAELLKNDLELLSLNVVTLSAEIDFFKSQVDLLINLNTELDFENEKLNTVITNLEEQIALKDKELEDILSNNDLFQELYIGFRLTEPVTNITFFSKDKSFSFKPGNIKLTDLIDYVEQNKFEGNKLDEVYLQPMMIDADVNFGGYLLFNKIKDEIGGFAIRSYYGDNIAYGDFSIALELLEEIEVNVRFFIKKLEGGGYFEFNLETLNSLSENYSNLILTNPSNYSGSFVANTIEFHLYYELSQ